MIPTPEQLEEISRLREGALGTPGPRGGPRDPVPFAALLLAFSAHRRTVIVEVRRKQISKRIVFEHGVPVDCRTNLVHETLGRHMVAQGKLAAEDLHAYLGQSASLGLPLGEVLLDHDVVTAEELFRVLQENLAKKLLDVFAWRDGDFRTHADVPHPQSPLKIRVPQLVVTGITKFAPQEEVDAGIVPLVGKKLCLNPSPPCALEEVRLNQRQAQVAVALRSGWRIDELALGTALPFEEITRLLYALAMLGMVITADQLAALRATHAVQIISPDAAPPHAPSLAAAAAHAAGAAEPGTAAKAAGARTGAGVGPGSGTGAGTGTGRGAGTGTATGAPDAAAAAGAPRLAAAAVSPGASSPSSPSSPSSSSSSSVSPSSPSEASPSATAYRNEIMQAYLSYRRLDAFDLLGAEEDASPAAVESRYLDFARRFAPWTLAGPELAGMEEKARDLFLAGARAYAELLDLEQRNTVLFRRKARREERNRRAPADLPGIKTDLLDPEVQYRKGRALMDAGKLQEAALLIEFASDCDPQNGLYSAELAYCRFCLAPGQGARALKELQETLRRDPDCGLAVYYTGEVHRQMGDREDAEKMLRRAIKMMAPDRRPIEALKLLSAEKRR